MNIESLYRIFLESDGICTDTRKITPNCLFFALKGENFNGNKFAYEALQQGARLVVVDEEQYHKSTEGTFLVSDTLTALQELATHHRNKISTTIIGLTGSNGKTTTKELINAVLSQGFKTVATKGNLNNHIGVPLTILSMDYKTEIGIVEMGANHLGEIKMLSEIARPDYGYITNFGKAHLEGFGSLEGVVKGKTELYSFLRNYNKKVFVNAADFKQMENSTQMDRITFGTENSDFPIELLDSRKKLAIKFQNKIVHSNLVGAYNFGNIAAAIAMGAYFKIPMKNIKKGIENYNPTNNRSQIIKKGSNLILMDAYNANPTSMMAALENFKQTEGNNKILFLGDMFELGPDSASEHQNIVDYLTESDFEKAILIGENFYGTKVKSPYILKLKTFDEAKIEISNRPPLSANILIKASRGMALERILDLL